MKKVIGRVRLNSIPFDRWDDSSHGFIHATGDYIILLDLDTGDKSWRLEYEDDLFDESIIDDDDYPTVYEEDEE